MNKDGRGKTILIGISYFDKENRLIEQYQTSGTIDTVTETKITIKRKGYDELFVLPNDNRAIMEASPGEYREKTTGKIIKNPSFISQWAIYGDGSKEHLEEYKRCGFETDIASGCSCKKIS